MFRAYLNFAVGSIYFLVFTVTMVVCSILCECLVWCIHCRSRRQQDQLLREAQDQAFRESLEADREKERKRKEGERREEEERERQREREREERLREEVGHTSCTISCCEIVLPRSPGAGGEAGSVCEPSSSRARGGRPPGHPRDAAYTWGRATRETIFCQ